MPPANADDSGPRDRPGKEAAMNTVIKSLTNSLAAIFVTVVGVAFHTFQQPIPLPFP
jgi:hypothetical protein